MLQLRPKLHSEQVDSTWCERRLRSVLGLDREPAEGSRIRLGPLRAALVRNTGLRTSGRYATLL